MNTILTDAMNKLSEIQKKAVDWNEGSLLVLAGPGAGKTRVLTCRIARLLEATKGEKHRILGLTFTNKAADEMRSRVETLVPGEQDRLFLNTFHSFCADILRQHGSHLGIKPNFNIYSQDADLQSFLNEAIEKNAKSKSEFITDLDKKTLPVIKRLKSLLIFPENCEQVFEDEEFGKRMSIVYLAYEAMLSEHNALDFESLILKAYELFAKFPSFAKRYRTVFKYICIDEFQDTNVAQYNFIRAITGDVYKNLLVVADDDQIIYQWNGASHRRLEEFIKDYSPKIIQLPMNYRCPPEIVELANNLISYNFLRTKNKEPLKAFRTSSGKDVVRLLPSFSDFEQEAYGVAADINKNHRQELGSVTILARSRKLLEVIESALKESNLPAYISQRKDEFESAPFVWLHSMLRLANDRQNRQYLDAICGTFFQLADVDIDPDEIVAISKSSNSDYLRNWVKLGNQKNMIPIAKKALDEVSRCLTESNDFKSFVKFAQDWIDEIVNSKKSSKDPLEEVFIRYKEERRAWNEIFKEINKSLGTHISLEALLQELQMRSKEPPREPNSITLMTIHGAKGKEFDHVYLIGLVDDELPSFQSKQKGDNSHEMEEERRNCFVAITRTIKTLTLSYAKKYRGWSKNPSRFLMEMGLIEN